MNIPRWSSLILLPICSVLVCSYTANGQNRDTNGLKDYYKAFFPMGVAIRLSSVSGPESELIVKHFESITAENAMKMGPIHPKENEYNWKGADDIVAFGVRNNMKIRGHTLCWHSQAPQWIFKDQDGKDVTKEVLLQRLKEHITTVVSRYKGKIYAWDAVNEVIDDNDEEFYRDSPWYRICGEDFIAKAFEYAHEADPDALLFYNDYNTENAGKRDRIYQMVKGLLEKKVPIHGIGLQGHWSIYHPSEEELRASLDKFSSLGLTLQVTELDVSVYKSEPDRRDKHPDESDAFTQELEQLQRQQYQMIFKVLREYKDKISGVTFWNVSDRSTWLDNFPVRGRKNYPLLFDQNYQPKKVYQDVVRF